MYLDVENRVLLERIEYIVNSFLKKKLNHCGQNDGGLKKSIGHGLLLLALICKKFIQ